VWAWFRGGGNDPKPVVRAVTPGDGHRQRSARETSSLRSTFP
jgi:hypothetical protein